MNMEELIKSLVESFESIICQEIDSPSSVDYICTAFEEHLRKLCNSVDIVRKEDLNVILNKHFVNGNELCRSELLRDILNLLN